MAEFRTMRTAAGSRSAAIDAGLRAHMNKVYGTMSVGMVLTFLVAWAVGSSPELLSIFRDPMTLRPNMLGWAVMFAPLIMAFVFGAALNRLSVAGAQTFFYAFAAVMGLSLSWIFVAFTGVSIAQVFLVTAISFAGLSLWGYTTKRDLSAMGTFLMMGVIGILIASVVNIFLASSALQFAITILGVLLFAGLTAYDTQNIKTTYIQHARVADQEWLGKAAIMGALQLYLDFINMFMFLLQLFGNRD
ncbi:Bax inhibitor-1/YccA family protein [Pseudooceanicola sp. CBS1P-1]|uniref:BAX inhibitor (BI)-1/YccA family protein n=1 Tax=Pseudooceanicola albus TaxID=2692189 RepID=A0A6L7G4E2_9RHOB|nr:MULTISPECIES: Bax inhibitor-1/YccA family protein [Pseudooceanicola]MBT9384696.1 Bax inhibitor-1/YccA family protein [Pseudooceanicola endophyticus]MXN18397.1 BAX inhibitor (BI)-1/YccA family protein [Pseudooceanicola albus]